MLKISFLSSGHKQILKLKKAESCQGNQVYLDDLFMKKNISRFLNSALKSYDVVFFLKKEIRDDELGLLNTDQGPGWGENDHYIFYSKRSLGLLGPDQYNKLLESI